MKWPQHKVADIADLCLGKMLDQRKNKGTLRPYLANVNVRWGSFELSNLREMRFEERELERYGVLAGDIVMCEGGEPGRCAIWREQLPGMMLQKALHRIRTRPGVDHRFLYYTFLDYGRAGKFEQFFTGSTIKHLPGEKLAMIDVPVPPLDEQRRIAAILSAYDNLIENNTRRIAILEEMARGIYEEWFVHFRFPGHERVRMVESELGLLPKDWECRRLNELYQTSSGGTPSRKQREYFTGDIPWVKTRELDDGCIFSSEERITEEAVKNSSAKIFPPGTVLIAMYGATIGKLGTLAVPAATNQACCAVIPKIEGFGTEYAFLTLLFARGRLIDLRAGAAQQNINQDTVRTLLVVRPAKETLFAFNTLVAPLFACSANLRLQNTNLRTTRDLLLPKLISGELDVLTLPEPEAVAA